MKKLLALFFSLALVFSFSTTAAFAANYGKDGVDKDCKDFKSQQEAQKYFEGDGGSKSNNVDDLDRDHDGKACEDYKYKGGDKGSDDDNTGDIIGGGDSDNNNSGNSNSGNDNGSNDSNQNKDSSQGGKMPKTATNYPIAMFTGALLLLAGMVTLKLRRN